MQFVDNKIRRLCLHFINELTFTVASLFSLQVVQMIARAPEGRRHQKADGVIIDYPDDRASDDRHLVALTTVMATSLIARNRNRRLI